MELSLVIAVTAGLSLAALVAGGVLHWMARRPDLRSGPISDGMAEAVPLPATDGVWSARFQGHPNRMVARLRAWKSVLSRDGRETGPRQLRHGTTIPITTGTLLCVSGAALILKGWPAGWGLLCLGGVALGPTAMRRMAARRRAARFHAQFPEALDLMARALRAGHAVTTTLAMVAEESPDPLREEFRSVVQAMRFGKPLSDALKDMAARLASTDVNYWVACLLIQRETGGNLPELLEEVSRSLRKRSEFAAKVRAVTSEARLSATLLTALPLVLALLIALANPDYLDPLVTTPLGNAMIAIAVLLMVTGGLAMRRMMAIRL